MQYLVERTNTAGPNVGKGTWGGDWVDVVTTAGLTWLDTPPANYGAKTYRVRTIKKVTTASGAYDCLSQGVLSPRVN
ncbi:MAG: hypothetical protein L0Z50_31035 [Verrucomicrobiales bacterium]|nr:hypothetical protein [Verrucomicrobiales bacterium]